MYPPPPQTQLADDLLAQGPTDGDVIHYLSLVLRPNGRQKDLTAALENAVAKGPLTEDLLLALFSAYVR